MIFGIPGTKRTVRIIEVILIHICTDILCENGERIFLIKNLIPKRHLDMTLLDFCVSEKMGHCGCMKRSRVNFVSQTSTFLYTG